MEGHPYCEGRVSGSGMLKDVMEKDPSEEFRLVQQLSEMISGSYISRMTQVVSHIIVKQDDSSLICEMSK